METPNKPINQHLPYIYTAIFIGIISALLFFGGSKLYEKVIDMDKNNKLALANFTEMNKKNVLLKVIDTRMKISVEQKVKLRDTIYDLCYLRDIDIALVCGLIEVESGFNPEALSEANAKGLFQTLPSTARPYLRYERIDYSEKVLFDPVKSAIVGISYLADLHAGHVEAGKNDSDYTLSLHSYFWGGSNTSALYGKKDARVNVPNMSYPLRVLDAAKKYREMGL